MSGNQSRDLCALGARHLGLATSLPIVAGWVFLGFGTAMVLGGILLAVDDPAGLALVAFGTVFAGAGILAQRRFRLPDGQKAVLVGTETIATDAALDGNGRVIRSAVIHVDVDADEAESEAARRDWLRTQWQARPDWVAGRLIAEDERNGYWQVLAAWLWCGFAALSVVAALIWGGIAMLVAVGAVITAAAMVVLAVRLRWRRRRFGASHLALDDCPIVLGGTLTGLIETGIDADRAPPQGFVVELSCSHRWEQAQRSGPGSDRRTRRRRQVLWMQALQHCGQAVANGRHLSVPVCFKLPGDRPTSSIAGSSDEVIWELAVSATLPGSDFAARFQLPVLSPETAEILALSGKTRSYPKTASGPLAVTNS